MRVVGLFFRLPFVPRVAGKTPFQGKGPGCVGRLACIQRRRNENRLGGSFLGADCRASEPVWSPGEQGAFPFTATPGPERQAPTGGHQPSDVRQSYMP